MRRRLAVDGGVERQDDLGDRRLGGARDEAIEGQVLGPMPSSGESTPPST